MKRVPSGSTAQGAGAVPAVVVDELAERAAAHRAVVPGRPAERDGGGHEHAVRDAEQRAQLVLDQLVPGGHHARRSRGRGRRAAGSGRPGRCWRPRWGSGRGSGPGTAAPPPVSPRSGRRSAASCAPCAPSVTTRRRRSPRRSGRGRPSPATSRGTPARAAPWPRRRWVRRAARGTGTAAGSTPTAPGWRATGSWPGPPPGSGRPCSGGWPGSSPSPRAARSSCRRR